MGTKGWKIKTACILVSLSIFSFAFAEETIQSFIIKARAVSAAIEKKEAEYGAVKIKYEKFLKLIEGLKQAPGNNVIMKYFSSTRLAMALRSGNSTAYKIYTLDREIKALKDDYFTYVMLITEEYTKQFRDCAAARCAELREIYSAREKWVDTARDYADLSGMDAAVAGAVKDMSEDARGDLKYYIEKKLVQIEERISILEEEREISAIAIKAGIKPGKSRTGLVDRKAEELKELKKKIEALKEKIRE